MLKPKFCFISGLPRSGSTLLAALLRQNPRFYARMSSPLAGVVTAALAELSGESAPLVSEGRRKRVLRGLFESYYDDESNRDVIFDTNRGWCARLPILLQLFGEVRMICMVRNVAWIMDSIERLVRHNALDRSGLFKGDKEIATVYSRSEALADQHRTIGYACSSMKEAFYGEHASSMLVVDYEYIARFPAQTMDLIYEFIGEERFVHKFDELDYDEPEFDRGIATPGMHRVGRQVNFSARRTILPPDLFARFEKMNFWTERAHSLAKFVTPVAMPDVSGTDLCSNVELRIDDCLASVRQSMINRAQVG